MKMARSMLHEKKLPIKFWGEVVNIVIFLLNRLPSKAVEKQTLFETWSGIKLYVSFLRVFRCICYAQILFQKRMKLEEKAVKGCFLRVFGCICYAHNQAQGEI